WIFPRILCACNSLAKDQLRRHTSSVDSSPAFAADPAELASAAGPESAPRPTAQQVFQEHATYAWRALRYCGVAPADLQVACQEVLLVVHRRLPEFEQRSSMRTWVYG